MEREKKDNVTGSGPSSEIKIEDLKDDDRVVLRSGPGGLEGLEVGADGGFIRRLGKVVKKHQREVKPAVVGGAIIAVVFSVRKIQKTKEDSERTV